MVTLLILIKKYQITQQAKLLPEKTFFLRKVNFVITPSYTNFQAC